MNNCDYDSFIENLRIAQNRRPSDRPKGSSEQFARYDASAHEFAREANARYRAMREGNEVAHDLVGAGCGAAVEETPCLATKLRLCLLALVGRSLGASRVRRPASC